MRHIAFAVLLCSLACAQAQNAAYQTAPSKPAAGESGILPPKPAPDDKNADGSPKYKTYEDYIEALVDWKIEKRIDELKRASQTPAPSQKAPIPRDCSPAIDSQIDGDFNGWEGDTVYQLRNGQIWRQSSYHYHYHYTYAPNVLIFDSGHGCTMTVRGDDDEPVSVVRLR